MNTSNTCPKCGAAMPADAPEALCPACLMSGATASNFDTAKRAAPPWSKGGRTCGRWAITNCSKSIIDKPPSGHLLLLISLCIGVMVTRIAAKCGRRSIQQS